MNTRVCTRCGEEKPYSEDKSSEFSMYTSKQGVRRPYSICKKCKREAAHRRWFADVEKSRRKSKEKYQQNRAAALEKAQRYRRKPGNREILIEKHKAWYAEKGLAYSRERRKNTDVKEKEREAAKRFRERHPEKVKETHRKSKIKRREQIRAWKREYENNKRKTNNDYRILVSLRNRVGKLIKRKSASSLELLGCSVEEFRKHLESKFSYGMSWDNYGEYWHIDHIVPCKYFDLTNGKEAKVCFHYINTQPLTVAENCSKQDTVPDNAEQIINSIKKALRA